ncbi:MAG: hypothetical protein IPP13_07575 [Kouleothrix sp.]|jgi:hypothetical protein|nr:hypothetical protein [Kouleothrix sp.]
MPRLSQLMVRTALVWLALGYSFGGLVLFTKGVSLLPWLWVLRTAHIHALLVGWTVQLACGVAFWILPRLDASGSRGDERPVWGCYAALNSGVVLAVLHSVLSGVMVISRWLPLVVGLCYLATAALFFRHAWPRIVPFRVFAR